MIAGFSNHGTRKSTGVLVVLLAGAFLLVPSPFATSAAGPAGPVDSTLDEHSFPPRQATLVARTPLPAPYLAINSGSGVRQRLLTPTAYRHQDAQLPDFEEIEDIYSKKVEFFSFLKPLVEQENQRLLAIRKRLGYIQDFVRFQQPIAPEDQQWLIGLEKKFRMPEGDPYDPEFWPALLRRVDVLPVELVLVQAANESAWGTSRFAREGNNLFGQWCFRPGCGIVPAERPGGATYEVASFDSIRECIRSYMHNLNTGRVYEDLRVIREQRRAEGSQAGAAELAKGLTSYSERGMAYVAEIRAMLRQNAHVIAQLGHR